MKVSRSTIIALPPDSFAALYPSLSALHPVAFLLSGAAGGPAAPPARAEVLRGAAPFSWEANAAALVDHWRRLVAA